MRKTPIRIVEEVEKQKCKSQDTVGEIGTGIWVGKPSENTDLLQGTVRGMIRISPTVSWDLRVSDSGSYLLRSG